MTLHSLSEVLHRRFQHREYEEPQLVLIDGGKGQLSSAVAVLKDMGFSHIPIAAIAKARVASNFLSEQVQSSEERFFLPNRKNPCVFSSTSPAFRILTQLRNEAHRFALSYHRKLSNKSIFK